MTASATVIAVLAGYLAILVMLGIWSRSESKTIEGYFVANKRLPSWVVAFSSNATGESGWLLLGLTGMGYLVGVHALWIVLGEVLGVALSWVFIARPFKAFTDRYESITVADYLETRFRDTRHWLRFLSVVIILSMVAAYLAAQLVATGKAFQTFLGMSYACGVLLGAAITIFYTTLGGFKAVAYTDVLQGIAMAIGLAALAVVGIYSAGGFSPMMSTLHDADPNLLVPMGSFGLTVAGAVSVLGFLAVGIAFAGVPQLLVRFMSARSQHDLVTGSWIAVTCIVIFDTSAVFAGMAGRSLFPGLEDHETIMPLMSSELFPAFITGILVVVVLGAIMSTVDSLLILASSAVVRDLIQKIFRPDIPEVRLTRMGKWTTILMGLIAIPFALAEVKVVFWFVLFAWSGLATAFAPVIICSLFWKRTTLAGAAAGMAGGFLTTVIWVLWFKAQFYDMYEMLPGFFVGMTLTVFVSWFTKPPDGLDEEFDFVKAEVHRTHRLE